MDGEGSLTLPLGKTVILLSALQHDALLLCLFTYGRMIIIILNVALKSGVNLQRTYAKDKLHFGSGLLTCSYLHHLVEFPTILHNFHTFRSLV